MTQKKFAVEAKQSLESIEDEKLKTAIVMISSFIGAYDTDVKKKNEDIEKMQDRFDKEHENRMDAITQRRNDIASSEENKKTLITNTVAAEGDRREAKNQIYGEKGDGGVMSLIKKHKDSCNEALINGPERIIAIAAEIKALGLTQAILDDPHLVFNVKDVILGF